MSVLTSMVFLRLFSGAYEQSNLPQLARRVSHQYAESEATLVGQQATGTEVLHHFAGVQWVSSLGCKGRGGGAVETPATGPPPVTGPVTSSDFRP